MVEADATPRPEQESVVLLLWVELAWPDDRPGSSSSAPRPGTAEHWARLLGLPPELGFSE